MRALRCACMHVPLRLSLMRLQAWEDCSIKSFTEQRRHFVLQLQCDM